MTGRRSFDDLRKSIPRERQERNRRETRALLKGMALYEMRVSRGQSQEEMAAQLSVGQPAVAKMERREDLYVSNLRRYVEALGGTLEIHARFGDTLVPITGLGTSDAAQ
jgi:transcriptional regulator with XRE-family HTH domain